jgi:AcrR family transcriptional regulator
VSTEPGLRERKKQQTRQSIADTARALFAERGFDRVTVAEVARAANVSEATVFNYFPTKEDLVFSGLEAFETALVGAVRDRAPGESIGTAFGRFVAQPRGLLSATDPATLRQLAGITRAITESPALLARERQIFDRYTRALAELIAGETRARPDDVAPWVIANALIGVHRALIEYARRQVHAGRSGPPLARAVRIRADRAIGVLERGLAGLGAR